MKENIQQGNALDAPIVAPEISTSAQKGEYMRLIRMLSQIMVCGAIVLALAGCFAVAPTDRRAETMKGASTSDIIGYPKTIASSELYRVRDRWKEEKEMLGQPVAITGGAGHGRWVFKSKTPMYLDLRYESREDGITKTTDIWSEEPARDFTVMIHHRSEKVTRMLRGGFSHERFLDRLSWKYSAGGKSVGLNGTWSAPPSVTSPSTVGSSLGKHIPLDAGERATLLSGSWEGTDKAFTISVLFSPSPPEETGIVNSKRTKEE